MELDSNIDVFHQDFLKSLLEGNKTECLRYTGEYLAENQNLISLYEKLYRTVLYHVGYLWEKNSISVAQEHLATATIESTMNIIYSKINPKKRIAKKVIVTCAVEEQHQVGAKMVADVFEQNGWDTDFLGASTPLTELITFIEKQNPEMLCISLSIYFNIQPFTEMIKTLNSRFPELKILVGGQAFRYSGAENGLINEQTTLIRDLDSLQLYLNSYRG